jgi:hypothetical protein
VSPLLLKLIYMLWLTGMGLQFLLSAVLASRKTWRYLPVFTGFSIFCLLQNVVCYVVRGNVQHAYAYVYWVTESVVLVLGVLVIYEVFTKFLTPYPALHGLARSGFRWTIGLLFLISLSVICFHAPVEGSRFVAGAVVLEQATRVAEVGLLVFLFSFSRIFGLHWRQHIFGVAVGLGLFTTVELIGVTVRAHFGIAAWQVFNLAGMLSYNISLLVWIGYLLVREQATSAAEMPKRAQLEQWNQAIMELIHQ